MDRSGICEQLRQHLQDDHDPARIQHSLISQIRTLIIQQAQSWDDLSDTQLLGEDNAALDRMAQPYLKRPVGRPPEQLREWCHELYYKAESWDQHRRIVLVVSERPDDLFLHHFFLVTSLDNNDWHAHEVLSLHRKRGKAEGHMASSRYVKCPPVLGLS